MGFFFIGTVKMALAQNERIMLDQITFDQLPNAIANILDGIAEIKSICNEIRNKDTDKDEYLTVEELCAYHPAHPSHQTVRRWKRLGYIPYYKDEVTRRLKFKKSEIDAWLASSRHMSQEELNEIHDAQMLARRKRVVIGDYDDDE